MDNSAYYLNSVGNAMRVLDLLSTQKSMTITEIHRALAMGKTTAFRLLYTLEACGFVERLPDAQYCLSSKFIRYGNLVLGRKELVVAAKPFLEELCESTGFSCQLAVLDRTDGAITFLCNEAVKRGLQSGFAVGSRMQAYRCAAGKLLLSSLDKETLEMILSGFSYEEFTENTVTSSAALRRELTKIREQGYAEDNEESEIGLSCLAAPVYDMQGSMAAAISVSGATACVRSQREEALSQLRSAALHISRQFGY